MLLKFKIGSAGSSLVVVHGQHKLLVHMLSYMEQIDWDKMFGVISQLCKTQLESRLLTACGQRSVRHIAFTPRARTLG